MIDQLDLLGTAIFCGGLFAAWRVCVTVFYPAISGMVWQRLVGPDLVARWPSLGQAEDSARPSYLPLADAHPYVVTWGLLPPPLDDITQGVRDGIALGVYVALLPELLTAGLLTLLLALVIGKTAWRVSRASGSAKTDGVIWGIRDALVYGGAIASLQAVGLFASSAGATG